MPPETREIRGLHRRAITLDRKSVDQEARTVEVAISSETPVARWFGLETLGHKAGEVDLARLADGGPVLLDHNTRDIVGVVERVRLDGDLVLRGTVRFGRGTRAEEAFQDVLDGIRTKISVGYQVEAWETTKGRDGAPDQVRVTRWTPLEVSFVAVPADASVGVGRAFEPTPAPRPASTEVRMDTPTPPVAAPQGGPNYDEQIRAGAVAEALEIRGSAERLGLAKDADEMLRSNLPAAQIRAKLLDLMVQRGGQPMGAAPAVVHLTETEQRKFSIARAILASTTGERCFEREVSDELQKKLGRQTNGILIPTAIHLDRALDTKTPAQAGGLISTEPITFVELLRNNALVLAMGATYLPGMSGTVPFARQISGGNAQWTGDSPAAPGIAESNPSIETFSMTPKQLMAHRAYSKQLLVQTGGFVDRFVTEDLAAAHALEIDRAALHGSGAGNEPRGLANFAGIGAVAVGANGGALTWEHLVGLETEVAIDNALAGNLGYLTNPKVRGKLKTTLRAAAAGSAFIWDDDSTINGYKAQATNQVRSDLAKGTGTGLSAVFFGNWREMLVLEWGALELITDPYTLATQGLVRVVSTQFVDMNLRHVGSFAACLDAQA